MPGTAHRSLAALLAVVLVVLPLGPAAAKTPAPVSPQATAELGRARRLLESGEFERSVKAVEGVLFQDEQLPEAVRAEAYRLLGLAELYLGNETSARSAYEKLLEIQPDYELPPSTPPKVKAIYERIQADLAKRRLPPVTLDVVPLGDLKGDQTLAVRAFIDNMAPGLKAKLYYRRPPSRAYSSVDFLRDAPEGRSFTATLPAYDLKAEDVPYPLEYYIEVADGARRRLAGRGIADEPLRFQVLPLHAPPEPPRPWYKNPWVWVIGGVVVAGATAGVIVWSTQRSAP